MSDCSNNPIITIIVFVIIALVVLAVILAGYGTVITFFYQRNKIYLKRNLNSKRAYLLLLNCILLLAI